ncbi:thioredoxin domain-containing protein [Sessilibacter sp. MAH2]
MTSYANILAEESSPYLLQHKDNPVHWQTWSPKVLEDARLSNKPIFLSVGYSANHWCRVMASETFSSPAIARELNENFICIKVDREERPDIDDIYQTGHQLLAGQPGGWPLTVFLCPQTLYPFVVGTYYPPTSNTIQLGFADLMQRVLGFYHGDQEQYHAMIEQVRNGYNQLDAHIQKPIPSEYFSLDPAQAAVRNLLQQADPQHGGFGEAPKFALSFQLQRLMIAGREDSLLGKRARQHLQLTLAMMARGGIRDVLAGGFFRYSTDATWSIPHFEKMLYDNASLLAIYAESARVFNSQLFAKTAQGIASWMCAEMSNGYGAFYSALDADSERGDGGYYCWQTEELKRLLTPIEYRVMSILCKWQGMPNFLGLWHLQIVGRVADVVSVLDIEPKVVNQVYRRALAKLLAARRRRPAPERDHKILCASNALAIRGLSIAGRILNDVSMINAAQECLDFISHNLWIDGRLYATWQGGEAKILGFLDDYVFLMDAILESLQSNWRDQDFRLLVQLADFVMDNFNDPETGSLYFSSDEHEQLIYRSKPIYDRVTPAGNGIAAKVFARLGNLSSEQRYFDKAGEILQALWTSIELQPQLHDSLLQALVELKYPPVQVMLTGPEAGVWRERLVAKFINDIHCYAVVDDVLTDPTLDAEPTRALLCIGADQQNELESYESLESAIVDALAAQPLTTGDKIQ